MKSKLRIFIIALFAMALISFLGVSCIQYISTQNSSYIDMDSVELVQNEKPKDGDPIAVIKTSLGDIKVLLYPEYAPNAVENFVSLAESGFYDNTYVFHSEPGICFGAGSHNKDGTLGDDYNSENESVVQEIHQNLWPFKGALCSLITGKDGGIFKQAYGDADVLNGSRFMVVNSINMTEDIKEELRESNEKVAEAFIEKGGVPNYSQRITIFGQTYEGFDVIDKLTDLEVEPGKDDKSAKIPIEDIMIETVEIGVYSSAEESASE